MHNLIVDTATSRGTRHFSQFELPDFNFRIARGGNRRESSRTPIKKLRRAANEDYGHVHLLYGSRDARSIRPDRLVYVFLDRRESVGFVRYLRDEILGIDFRGKGSCMNLWSVSGAFLII